MLDFIIFGIVDNGVMLPGAPHANRSTGLIYLEKYAYPRYLSKHSVLILGAGLQTNKWVSGMLNDIGRS